MNKPEVNNNNKVWLIVKYILGFLGIIGIATAILTVTNTLDEVLIALDYKGTLDANDKLTVSLVSSILGIFFIFIALSKQIDQFFNVIERKEVVLSKKEESGVSIELIFFLFIAIVLIVLAVLMGIDYLAIKTDLPLLGKYTEGFIIGALIVLALLAIVTAFNEIIGQSLKEMKKVHWPTSEQMSKFSAQVFAFIIFFSVLFFVLDLLIGKGLAILDQYLA